MSGDIKTFTKLIPGTVATVRTLRAVQASVLRTIYRDRFHEVVLTKVWRRNIWGDSESRSGPGSNLNETRFLRGALSRLLMELGVCKLLDIPCGDFHRMKEVEILKGLVYLGGDIVQEMIRVNNDRCGGDTISFEKLDILRDPLSEVDLVLRRDCLVHFSTMDVFRAIGNLKRSGSKHVLLTHYAGDRSNRKLSYAIPG
jgi:SAM-dependent methyltransferase